jgi:hypothetical protein
MAIPSRIKITCHKCGKLVRHATVVRDDDLDQFNFLVECHDKIDQCALPRYYLDHPEWIIVDAIAFRPPRAQGQIRP